MVAEHRLQHACQQAVEVLIEKRNKADHEVWRVTVRYDNGRTAQFDYERIDNLRVGDRVKVEDGKVQRL